MPLNTTHFQEHMKNSVDNPKNYELHLKQQLDMCAKLGQYLLTSDAETWPVASAATEVFFAMAAYAYYHIIECCGGKYTADSAIKHINDAEGTCYVLINRALIINGVSARTMSLII